MDNYDLCQLLGVTKRTLARYRQKRYVTYYMIDGRTYYKASEVEAFLNQKGKVLPAKLKSGWMCNSKRLIMEIVCIDKQTFDELRARFCKLEEKMAGVCRPMEDSGLKNWIDKPGGMRDIAHIEKRLFRCTVTRESCRSRVSSTRFSSSRTT